MKKIAFIDLEASGLSAASWPIEVGWCFAGRAPETMLIRPVEEWPDAAWEEKAEALHGIRRDLLQSDGVAPSHVCARMNAALAGAAVYSDAPDWDGFWLYRLFAAAGEKQAFALADFASLLARYPADKVRAAMEKAALLAPHRHRAHEDVLHMKTVYELASAEP